MTMSDYQAVQPLPVDESAMSEQAFATALRRAFALGQKYWMQADSYTYAEHKKADETRATFERLVSESLAEVTAAASQKTGLEAENEKLRATLEKLDALGGLGHTAHAVIRAALSQARGQA
jgi:hypothetical protein